MKRRLINFVFSVFALIAFNGCSNLFENIINDVRKVLGELFNEYKTQCGGF